MTSSIDEPGMCPLAIVTPCVPSSLHRIAWSRAGARVEDRHAG